MAKYLTHSSGSIVEVSTVSTSAGAGDATKIPGLNGSGVLDPSIVNAATTGVNKVVLTDGTGRLDAAIMPVGFGDDALAIQCSENLSAGNAVNLYDGGSGTFRCRKADASNGRAAHGFVLASATSGNNATVYFEGTNTQVSGLSPGDVYLSGTTPGAVTNTPVSTSSYLSQKIGFATSATSFNFQYSAPITLA